MFNKGKIEDLNAEILLLNSKIAELSKFESMIFLSADLTKSIQ